MSIVYCRKTTGHLEFYIENIHSNIYIHIHPKVSILAFRMVGQWMILIFFLLYLFLGFYSKKYVFLI